MESSPWRKWEKSCRRIRITPLEEEKNMKGKRENQVRRSKSRVFNTEERRHGVSDRNVLRKDRESGRQKVVQKNGRVHVQVSYQRKEKNTLVGALAERKEVEVQRSLPRKSERSGSVVDQTEENRTALKKRRGKERDAVWEGVKTRSTKKGTDPKANGATVTEWKEQVARVGTGYRVRKDEKNPRKRRFDVGYADMKSYTRKEGREASVDSSNMGRTIVGKGKDARVKVMNAVCAMEKRRPASEYTGSGILRKSRVGKLKLKPTKPSGKE